MNNYKECLNFIENNKSQYLKFLCENFEGFPFVCDYSSQILMAYLSENYNLSPDIIQGCIDGDDEQTHYWIEIENIKVDFTLCQFLKNNQEILFSEDGENLFFNKSIENGYKFTYNTLIKDKVPFPFILDDNIWYDSLDYCNEEEIPDILINCANKTKGNFREYLNLVKELFIINC